MRPRLTLLLIMLLGLGLIAWMLSAPRHVDARLYDGLTGNAEHGKMVFAAAGCAACHVSPNLDEPGAPPVLSGGKSFATAFGTFYAPNISTDPVNGIGGWSDMDIINAVQAGTSPTGQHFYPVFPYVEYGRATPGDMIDLVAYLRTLPPSDAANIAQDVRFPFNIRRALGFWKLLYDRKGWVIGGDLSDQQTRGRYLVEALGHCGECHTPRTVFGGMDTSRWLSGAPNPSGEGRIPSLRSTDLGWSQDEIAQYLSSGFTPEYDTAGGEMVDVIYNTSQLTDEDRQAIAAYLIALPD